MDKGIAGKEYFLMDLRSIRDDRLLRPCNIRRATDRFLVSWNRPRMPGTIRLSILQTKRKYPRTVTKF